MKLYQIASVAVLASIVSVAGVQAGDKAAHKKAKCADGEAYNKATKKCEAKVVAPAPSDKK